MTTRRLSSVGHLVLLVVAGLGLSRWLGSRPSPAVAPVNPPAENHVASEPAPERVNASAADVDRISAEALERALIQGDPRAEVIWAAARPAFQQSEAGRTARGRIALSNAAACLKLENYGCAFAENALAAGVVSLADRARTERARIAEHLEARANAASEAALANGDRASRIEATAAALVMWDVLERHAATGRKTMAATLERTLERDRTAVEAAADAAARAEVTRLAAEARVRQIEEQRRRRAEERAAWASAPLLCRDGALSPTCSCGDSSHRGCCSWHGGIAGCSYGR